MTQKYSFVIDTKPDYTNTRPRKSKKNGKNIFFGESLLTGKGLSSASEPIQDKKTGNYLFDPSIKDWKQFRKILILTLIIRNEDGTTDFTKRSDIEPTLLFQIGNHHHGYTNVIKTLMDEGELPNFIHADKYRSAWHKKIGKDSLQIFDNVAKELLPIIKNLKRFPEASELICMGHSDLEQAIRHYHFGIYDVKDEMKKKGLLDDILKPKPPHA